MVREKYHFAKSWKSQGILTVRRHKVKRTFEFIFPLVQAWFSVGRGSFFVEYYIDVQYYIDVRIIGHDVSDVIFEG